MTVDDINTLYETWNLDWWEGRRGPMTTDQQLIRRSVESFCEFCRKHILQQEAAAVSSTPSQPALATAPLKVGDGATDEADPNYQAMMREVRALHRLVVAGQEDSAEADAIRDATDGVWKLLSEAQRQRVRELSEALYPERQQETVTMTNPNPSTPSQPVLAAVAAPLKVGDVVMLKSGGPMMTVTATSKHRDGYDVVWCMWFDGGQIHEMPHPLHADTLTQVSVDLSHTLTGGEPND